MESDTYLQYFKVVYCLLLCPCFLDAYTVPNVLPPFKNWFMNCYIWLFVIRFFFAWQCVQKCLGINRFSNFKLAQSYLGITRNLSDLRTILCRLLNYKFLKKVFSQPRRYESILCMHLIKSNVEGFDVFTALLCYGGGERDRRVGLYFIVRRYFWELIALLCRETALHFTFYVRCAYMDANDREYLLFFCKIIPKSMTWFDFTIHP